MRKVKQALLGSLMALTAGTASAGTFVGDRTDFRDETIYFAMTTRFYDGDPTNNVCSWDKQDVQIANGDPDWRGDFKGLIDKLDYIKALGFTAVWITPVVQNASGEDYHGYHAMDFQNVDLRYESRKNWGAEKDVKFQDLIDAAHAKGMKIILDVVLQHTGNFGEAYLNPLFTRDQRIRNQASVPHSLKPNPDRLSANYFEQDGKAQYAERFKYFKNPEFEPNNYYHHYGTGWNWDLPNRWWAQIAGDCVDLNTENNHVAEYIVKCYGKFIEMGVDGFRIDTTGHISPLTFNKQFIPQFQALGEKYKNKRLNGAPFYMFGECCQRFQGSVVYRDQPNLSSYFYTWKSDQSLLDEFNGDPAWWRQQTLPEGHDTPVGPMAVCEKDTKDKPRSNNVWMQNGQWHEPDYSQASGFNVIDFPVHYGFNSVGSIFGLFSQDNYYNDASFNVVYVDSHDYCPGPSDGTRFNAGTAQWAENLSFMFSFRGIPCIYYGSEVEFKKGKPIDVGGENNKTPRKDSGRAYFGEYLEGNVTATDFAEYTASGNVATTLNGDLAHHIQQLNKIRAAVPALRKGQYTFDGCSANGGWAFKRAYKDSYALVAVNGGATFSNVPSGTYTDIVTGKTYNGGGSITVDAPRGQGQLRVLVKGWTGGKVVEDGKFIYSSSPVAHGGNPTFADVPTDRFYTAQDVIDDPKVVFSPAGGSFTTPTQNVTVTLNEEAVSGWYQVGTGSKVNISKGQTKDFTVGEGMDFGQTVTVSWGATDNEGASFNGTVKYKKVDPNATITIYVKAPGAFNMYAWSSKTSDILGAWPGKASSALDKKNIAGDDFYYYTFAEEESVNVIFNNGGQQTVDITGITEDTYFEYDGATGAKKIEVSSDEPVVKFSPNGGVFKTETLNVTATVANATSAWYRINGEAQVNISGSTANFTIGQGVEYGRTITVDWSATGATGTRTGKVTYTKQDPNAATTWTFYYNNRNSSSWGKVNAYFWDKGNGNKEYLGGWPGKEMTLEGNLYKISFTTNDDITAPMIIFNNGSGDQTDDLAAVNNATYTRNGIDQSGINTVAEETGLKIYARGTTIIVDSPLSTFVTISGIDGRSETIPVEPGLNHIDYAPGLYIVNTTKLYLR